MKTFEIHPLIGLDKDNNPVTEYTKAVKFDHPPTENDPDVICWGVYERIGGIVNVFDVPTKEEAEKAFKVLTVQSIKMEIKDEFLLASADEQYTTSIEKNNEIFEALASVGYKAENDPQAMEGLTNVGQGDFWAYFLSSVITDLETGEL